MNAKTRRDVGEAKDDVLKAIERTQAMLLSQFQDEASAARIKKQLDGDVLSVYGVSSDAATLADNGSAKVVSVVE